MDTQGEVSGMHFMASKEQRLQPNIAKACKGAAFITGMLQLLGSHGPEYPWEESTALHRHVALGQPSVPWDSSAPVLGSR